MNNHTSNNHPRLWNNSLSRRKFLRAAGKVTAGVAIAGTGGVLQVFATTSGYVKVGENGTGTTTFVRSVPYSTWLSLSLSEQAAWTAMCGPMAFASLNKTDIEEAGVPSDFQDKVPEALTIGGSGGSVGQEGSGHGALWVYRLNAPIAGTRIFKERK
jgi:hypothetical protein